MIDKKAKELHVGYVHTKTEIAVIDNILLFVQVINHLACSCHDCSLRQTACAVNDTAALWCQITVLSI